MRFIVMHKTDATMEAGGPPDREIIKNMGALVGESLKNGVFLDGAGLHRSARRVRLRYAGGKCTATKGPYAGDNELVAGMFMIQARSIDHAIEYAHQFAAVLGDGEIEIGPVVERWDLNMTPKPADIETERFLLLLKSNPSLEAGASRSADVKASLRKLSDELTRAGVLLKSEALAPSLKGARLAAGPKGKRTWTDGPFTESKEMISGFSILNVASMDDAVAWANRYADILGGNEVDVRLMEDAF